MLLSKYDAATSNIYTFVNLILKSYTTNYNKITAAWREIVTALRGDTIDLGRFNICFAGRQLASQSPAK
jgi:hypothetical protein